MTDRWRFVNNRELYDMTKDPGQRHNVSSDNPEVVNELRGAYERYWASVSAKDSTWRGRPIIGDPHQPEVALCSEDWYSTGGECPWNQGRVARGDAVFGRWPVRFAEAGAYQFEVRRWPREADAPLAGVPTGEHVVDAQLDDQPVSGLLYHFSTGMRALPVVRVQLKVGASVQEAAVSGGDKCTTFTTKLNAGPGDIEAAFLDESGKSICSAYYVYARKSTETEP
jgi:hypothetical protein